MLKGRTKPAITFVKKGVTLMKTTIQKMMLALVAGFILVSPGFAQSSGQRHDGSNTSPIALSEITFAYATYDNAGKLVWEIPKPNKPNTIPASAQRLRFTAKVNNRPAGSKIRLRATLQEQCPSPDGGKNFLARLRHLTESDPAGTTPDPTDDEVHVVGADGRVTIEIPVHCEECGRASCGSQCPERDHLGEGPHIATLMTTDEASPQDGPQASRSAATAKPSSFRLNVNSVCPKAATKRPGK